MVPIEAIVPYDQGELLNSIHQIGMVERTVSSTLDLPNTSPLFTVDKFYTHLTFCEHLFTNCPDLVVRWIDFLHCFLIFPQEYSESGTFVKAHVPLRLARLLAPLRQQAAAIV